ncbi:hypothetical protein HGRIS_011227 [Hohenbuehelia grisea]|uniref:Uncharacterized protein n=1 Tax=Hohenbuehelia grisea TaxID=104357 RepID=A0ABR3JWN2_9AGAR
MAVARRTQFFAFATPTTNTRLEEQDHVAAKGAVTDGLLQNSSVLGKTSISRFRSLRRHFSLPQMFTSPRFGPTLCKTTVLAPASHDLDRPLLLRTMGWDDHLARWTGDRGSVKRLLSLPVLPRRPKTGIDPYAEVMPLCVSYIMDTGLWIKNTVYASRKALQEWLITHGGLHFSVHGVYKTIEETRFLAQLVVAALRMMFDQNHDHDNSLFPLDDGDRRRGLALLEMLKVAKAPAVPDPTLKGNSVAENTAVLALHAFVYPFFSAQITTQSSNKFIQVLECVYAFYALRDDGTFQPANLVTGYFARVKYLCRCIVWFESQLHLAKFDNNSYKAVVSFVAKDLAAHTSSAFSAASDYATYTASLAHYTTGPPICLVTDSGRCITYKNCRMFVPDYIAGLHLMADVIDSQMSVFLCGHEADMVVPNDATEDWTTTE